MKRVLAQPVYRNEATTAVQARPSLWERFVHWIGDKLGGLVRAFFRALRGAQSAGAVFGIALIVALLALLVLLLVRIVRFFAYGRKRPAAEAIVLEGVLSRSSAEWLAQARVAAARAEYAGAIAALFNAALRRLDERGLVLFDGALSPGEYRVAVRRAAAPASGAFDTVARRFVTAMFSTAPSEARDYEDALAAYGTLEAKTR